MLNVPKSDVLVARPALGDVVVEIIKCRRMSLCEVEQVEFPSAKIHKNVEEDSFHGILQVVLLFVVR